VAMLTAAEALIVVPHLHDGADDALGFAVGLRTIENQVVGRSSRSRSAIRENRHKLECTSGCSHLYSELIHSMDLG